MKTIDKLEKLKQRLYLEIQSDIKRIGYSKLLKLGFPNNTLFRIKSNDPTLKTETLVYTKKSIDDIN